jgi:hypothetical protein
MSTASNTSERARLDSVRTAVRRFLSGSRAFQSLPPAERVQFAHDMVKVVSQLSESGRLPEGVLAGLPPEPAAAPPAVVRALAEPPDPVESTKARLAKDPGAVGKGFTAGAVREGVSAFKDMVQTVDFPAFVGGLIQNVFQAVVDASIQQMRAFAELLSAAAKSVDQFASDHISDAQARDHIANRFPRAVRVEPGPDGGARLRPGDNAEGVNLGQAFDVDDGIDLSDEESEQALVNAAKLQMARQQQQQLSVMVLMGINRIVVTNGHINAKVVFDMRASDTAKRTSKASMIDKQREQSNVGFAAGWVGAIGGGISGGHESEHQTTVSSAVDDSSESKAAVKAQLSGDVRLAFKSETFPLERMVDLMGRELLAQKATPGTLASPVAASAGGARR